MSGGTTPVINNTLAGFLATSEGPNFFGIEGKYSEREDLAALSITPGSGVIGSTRLHSLTAVLSLCKAERIEKIVNVGGNGTLQQSKELRTELNIPVVWAPKTVDNDVGDPECQKMFVTPGYMSCLEFWHKALWAADQDSLGSKSYDQVFVFQAFGRKTGFITAALQSLDMPHLVLLYPERNVDALAQIHGTVMFYGRAIVVVTEGYDLGARMDYALDGRNGSIQYASSGQQVAQVLVDQIQKELGYTARVNIPGVLQRTMVRNDHDARLAYRVGRLAGFTDVSCEIGCGINGPLTYKPGMFGERTLQVDPCIFNFLFTKPDYAEPMQ